MSKPFGDSGGRPTALFLTPEPPYPLAGGGALRGAALLNYLATRYTVDVMAFREPASPDPVETIPRALAGRVGVVNLPVHSRTAAARAWRNLRRMARGVPPLVDRFAGFAGEVAGALDGKRYDLAVIEHFWCAPYVEQLARRAGRVVLDLHNVESVLHERCALTERWPVAWAHRWFARNCRRLERRLLPRLDLLLTASEADADRLRGLSSATPVEVYPNTIPAVARPERKPMDAIVFSGNMEYHPNIAAVRFFATRIWPLLRERWPGLSWLLIGKNPRSVLEFMERDPRIRVVGAVENSVEAIALAKVAVVPLLAASGTRIKILEAWAAGVPVVSTRIGAEGLPARHGEHLLVADDPAEFAEAVSALLESDSRGRQLAAAGRALYETEFTWEAGWRRLEKIGI